MQNCISKEAQKCFCEAPNCRGWIGETPEEEKEKIEKKEKREKDMKKKKDEKKPTDYMEDEDVSNLCSYSANLNIFLFCHSICY